VKENDHDLFQGITPPPTYKGWQISLERQSAQVVAERVSKQLPP